MRDRTTRLNPVYLNGVSENSALSKKIYGRNVRQVFALLEEGRNLFFFFKKDWDETAEYIAKRFLKDQSYYPRIASHIKTAEERMEKFIKAAKVIKFSELPSAELISWTSRFCREWVNLDAANTLSWYVAGDRFLYLAKEKLGLSDEEFDLVSLPTQLTRASQMDIELDELAIKVKSGRSKIKSAAQLLTNKYGWLPFGYDGPDYWDGDYFLKQITERIKNCQKISRALAEQKKNKDIISRKRRMIMRKLSSENKRLVEIAHHLAIWTDDRKYYHFRLHYHYARLMQEIAQRFSLDYWHLKLLFDYEMPLLIKDFSKAKKIISQRLAKTTIASFKSGQIKILSSSQTSKIVKYIAQQQTGKIIKGTVVSRGSQEKYRGSVRVVLQARDSHKVKPGEILVATMTTPDYIIGMQKAIAFVTDEGGLTCHAAIVAREMKKPCIVASRFATKMLKDGDRVEIDIKQGTVKFVK